MSYLDMTMLLMLIMQNLHKVLGSLIKTTMFTIFGTFVYFGELKVGLSEWVIPLFPISVAASPRLSVINFFI